MRDQQIFLTGGTGFFGCWLIESFIAANQSFSLNSKITVLTRNPDIFRERSPHLAVNPAVSLLKGDVSSFRFPEGSFPFVVHAAADTGGSRTGKAKDTAITTLRTILDGTRNTLDFAASHGTRKFMMISSGAVYGDQPSFTTEDFYGSLDPCLPENAYGEAKRAAEALCSAYTSSHGFACKIARCFAFVGPHLPLDGRYAIGNFIQSALTSQPIHIHGDGTPVRSYLYAADLTVWLWTVLFNAPSLFPINIGSDKAISIGQLAEEVRATLDCNLDILISRRASAGVPIKHYVPSVQRAYDQLKLKQTVELHEAIRRTAEWYGWTNVKE
ncbi:NAD-dependent epimerase/dehydratase family protein [Tunturiibacter gelidoferens]|uniref:NAD-dependent epimerase/dehydratase family protein n=1 Tax=Tunturiibacter gelidiferens TaxID=3069689 RepID=A0AAU7Z0X0_9BACT